ncbi:hypothetical protein BD309DRAFT_1003220 [Dichomitus squalens]|uniref:Structural maintenance of chromosomes protein 5 n=1 Tax=Dichomitus squalens TaxID=114155 RepID=A0A4V2K7R5_9APHY|nr:hypothetical protein BD309DRAFT_1003220 [Dichomitus squalens]TBU56978.1 hypothetical protein BD310DRAFT_949742 [Dichomitus squalens]
MHVRRLTTRAFRSGACLNTIFGPNSTGKSSISRTLCLGLARSPSISSRSPKIGKQDGDCQIKLKGTKGKSVHIVRRDLSSNSNSAQLMLNGRSSSGKYTSASMVELDRCRPTAFGMSSV